MWHYFIFVWIVLANCLLFCLHTFFQQIQKLVADIMISPDHAIEVRYMHIVQWQKGLSNCGLFECFSLCHITVLQPPSVLISSRWETTSSAACIEYKCITPYPTQGACPSQSTKAQSKTHCCLLYLLINRWTIGCAFTSLLQPLINSKWLHFTWIEHPHIMQSSRATVTWLLPECSVSMKQPWNEDDSRWSTHGRCRQHS